VRLREAFTPLNVSYFEYFQGANASHQHTYSKIIGKIKKSAFYKISIYYLTETDFHIFVRGGGGGINIWGGAAVCFGRGAVATPGKAKENV
jgi:hypothetical protein